MVQHGFVAPGEDSVPSRFCRRKTWLAHLTQTPPPVAIETSRYVLSMLEGSRVKTRALLLRRERPAGIAADGGGRLQPAPHHHLHEADEAAGSGQQQGG